MNLTIDRSALQGGGGFDWEDAVLISGKGQTNVTDHVSPPPVQRPR